MTSTSGEPPVGVRLLGPFEVVSEGRQLPIPGKQRALLAMLVLRLNETVPRDELIDQLWGETLPSNPAASLHSLVSTLRRALAGFRGAGGLLIRTREPGYALEGDPGCVDARCFERLALQSRQSLDDGELTKAAAELRQALGLWRGRALIDLDLATAQHESERLEEARLAAVEDLAEVELLSGRWREVVALLEPHVAEHPFRERACGQLMLALYRLGRQADSLAAYRRVRAAIVDELGLEPTPALRRLEEQILHQSEALDATPEPLSASAGPVRAGPSQGTVAVLFTDIAASTRRWESHREATARDCARHDALLRGVVARMGGEVFSHTGDGLAAVFPTASAALEAAVAGQRALADEPWAGGPLAVRMAVHAGTAERRDGNYFGPTLNRAARLLVAAAGGQVLCSGAAADLARDDLAEDVGLVDIGVHPLADLARPEHIYQVTATGLVPAFPALRGPGVARHNLPVALTTFVGRVSELDELRRLLELARLLTVTGVGGAGKTRLALELAGSVTGEFADGIWLVELGSLQDPASVADEVASAVGVPSEALSGRSGGAEDRLCAYLRGRRALILLDNCEHLVETTARLVRTVLTHCPDVKVLATSREVLGVPGETAWTVPPLSLPPAVPTSADDLAGSDAVALFCNRARAVHPGFAISTANAQAVARICWRLDGIPLAVELAAARVRVLSAQQIAERLDDRFHLLVGGGRAVLARHQTLRAAIDWSYQSLPPAERAVLARLSVFPTSFDLEAAAAVAMDEDDAAEHGGPGFATIDHLARLVDKSLVAVLPQERGDRYRLLETVREYAAEQLALTGATPDALRRHRDHFAGLADWDDLWWLTSEAAIRRAEADQQNLVTATQWSLEHDEYEPAMRLAALAYSYFFYASAPASLGLLEQTLGGPERTPTPERVVASLVLGVMLGQSGGDRDRSRGLLEQAAEMADRLGYGLGRAAARCYLGDFALIGGDVAEARRLLAEALAVNVEGFVRAQCVYQIGQTAIAAGDLQGAVRTLEEALDITRQGPYPLLLPNMLAALAPLLALAGQHERAESLAEEAMQAAAHLGLTAMLLVTLTRATEARLLNGDFRRARSTLRQLLQLLDELGCRRFLADALEMTALVAAEDRRTDVALRLLSTSRVMRHADGEPFGGTRAVSSLVRECQQRLRRAAATPDASGSPADRELSPSEAIAQALGHLGS